MYRFYDRGRTRTRDDMRICIGAEYVPGMNNAGRNGQLHTYIGVMMGVYYVPGMT